MPKEPIFALMVSFFLLICANESYALNAKKWWMDEWSCISQTGYVGQKHRIVYKLVSDTDCDGNSCTNNGGGVHVFVETINGLDVKMIITKANDSYVISEDSAGNTFELDRNPDVDGQKRANAYSVTDNLQTQWNCQAGISNKTKLRNLSTKKIKTPLSK